MERLRALRGYVKAATPAWARHSFRQMRRELKRLRRSFVELKYREHVASHTYGGLQLSVLLADPMGEKWYDRDWPELPEIALLKSHGLRPGATVFDIGAHQCVVAMMLAHPLGDQGTVLAVEALPRNAELGRRNCELNGYSTVRVVNAAVGEHSGRIPFSTDQHVSTGKGSPNSTVWVDSYSIDDLSGRFGWPDVLFVDIEGYEVRALLGASKTLERDPDCFIEVHVGCGLEDFGGSVESLVRFFPSDRFDLYLRAEADKTFDSFRLLDDRTTRRFFLIALARDRRALPSR